MKLTAAALTDIGQVRRKNEDAWLIDTDIGLAAVADGMGGHQAGEVASQLALETLRACLATPAPVVDVAAQAAVAEANRVVFAESQTRGAVQGMGTTVVFIWAPDGADALIAHVGDSRGYLLREGSLEQLTRDHSWVQAQVDAGFLDPREAATHPMRNVITRSIGFEPEIQADIRPLDLLPGDLFLLASDGLTGKLSQGDLAVRMQQVGDGDLDAALTELIAEANRRGGEDNITALLVRVDE